MDIKLKKSKAVIGLVSWLAGLVLLAVNVSVFLVEAICSEDIVQKVKCVMEEDYQQTGQFRSGISEYLSIFLSMSIAEEPEEQSGGRFDYDFSNQTYEEADEEYIEYAAEEDLWIGDDWEDYLEESWDDNDWLNEWRYDSWSDDIWSYYGNRPAVYYGNQYGYYMEKDAADEYHRECRDDRNLLYRIERDGEVLYTNEETLGFPEGNGIDIKGASGENGEGSGRKGAIFTAPEGYNFFLYFDGEKVHIWKDGTEINVYGDGFYRENSRWYVPGYQNFAAGEKIKDSRVYIAAAKVPGIFVKNGFGKEKYGSDIYYRNVFYSIQNDLLCTKMAYSFWLYTSVLAAALLFLGFVLRKERKEAGAVLAGFTGKLWYEVKLLPLFAVIFLFLIVAVRLCHDLHWLGMDYLYEIRYAYVYHPQLWAVSCFVLFCCVGVIWMFANDSHYLKKAWEKSLTGKIIRIYRMSSLKLPISRRIARNHNLMCLFIWVMCVAAILLLVGEMEGIFTEGFEFVFLFVVFLAALICGPLLFAGSGKRMAADMENLVGQIQAIHDGELREGEEMHAGSGLAEAMDNLKDIRNGMDKAVKEQTKSERMKVELVANVSHDIKTPLTSIISYVELLKQEEGLPEHVKEYVTILESKSQRLKSMVQDVFEVSKAASGNLPVCLENLDLCKLLRQTMADMEEQIQNSSVRVRPEIPEREVMIYADGERMYRVFQNLIQNALTYSLEGSRVYVTVRQDGEAAVACVKNTSREELPSGTDFTERFVRGDESRSDGGSGLGLSIARSFTEACGGSFQVEIIADLFVVTVSFVGKD